MSSGAKIQTHYIAEVTPGTTPAAPAPGDWKVARLTSNTLSPTPNTQVSDEITDTRLSQGSVVTGLTIGGNLVGEMSFHTFDAWLAAVFYGNWVGNVLTIGTERHTFSVQKAFTDVNTFHLFKGVHAATGSIEIPEEGKVTLTIGAQALDYEDAATSFVTAPDPATTTPFMSSLSVGDIKVDNISLAGVACVSAMTVNIDNTLQVQKCLGSGKLGPGALIETEAAITGTITLAWSAKAFEIWKEQMTRKAFGVTFPISDSGGNKYTLNFPAVEFDGELPSAGKRDLVQVSLNWTVAKVAPTITRTATAITSLTVTPVAPSIAISETVQLSAVALPAGTVQSVTWASDDAMVATVSPSGLVTGIGSGSATITATSTVDPMSTDTASVTVTI